MAEDFVPDGTLIALMGAAIAVTACRVGQAAYAALPQGSSVAFAATRNLGHVRGPRTVRRSPT